MSNRSRGAAGRAQGEPGPPNREMLELVLLLPTRQAMALERAARREGHTVGQVLRRLIREFLAGRGPRPS